MTAYLPPNLLALFAPRDPIPFMPPLDKLPHEKKLQSYIGVSQFMTDFEDPKDTPPPTRVETKDERKERKRKERQEQQAYKLEQELAMWNPSGGLDPVWTSDPFKTLFITRINYDTSESKLRREFEVFGPVRKINLAHNQKTGKPRGYAFIEYEHERDMHSAYKHADGKKIDGRRVLVDVERSRTVKGWRPRRLGGGLGGTRKGGPDVNTKYSGRDDMGMREDRDDDDRGGGRSPDRRRRRSRSRSRERPVRRRSRSPPRVERRRRSRSRERRRSRERPPAPPAEAAAPEDDTVTVIEGGEEEKRKRSRSRDRERKRRRSRSRERTRRSRSPRDRKRRRSRSRDKNRRSSRERKPDIGALGDGEAPPEESEDGGIKVEKVEKKDPNAERYEEEEQPEMFQNAMFTNEYPEEMENNYEYEQQQAVNGQ